MNVTTHREEILPDLHHFNDAVLHVQCSIAVHLQALFSSAHLRTQLHVTQLLRPHVHLCQQLQQPTPPPRLSFTLHWHTNNAQTNKKFEQHFYKKNTDTDPRKPSFIGIMADERLENMRQIYILFTLENLRSAMKLANVHALFEYLRLAAIAAFCLH